MGIMGPLIIYIVKKDESVWVGRQAVQSLLYHAAIGVGFVLFFALSLIVTAIGTIAGAAINSPGLAIGFGFGWVCCWPVYLLAVVVYGLYGAYECYQGHNFKYIIVSKLVTGL
jgi:uncharacterized Tic20 family protein